MRLVLKDLKKNNHPGDLGRQNASDTNQLNREVMNLALLWNSNLDTTKGDDLDGANLGDVFQMAKSVDMASKQFFYFDYGLVNQLHLKRKRDFVPITNETQDIKYEQFKDGMSIFFVPSIDNTGACTLRLNELASKELVLPDGSSLNVGSLIKDRVSIAKYDAALDKFILYNFSGQTGGAEVLQMEFGSLDSQFHDTADSPAQYKEVVHFVTDDQQFSKRTSLDDGAFFSFHYHKSVSVSDNTDKSQSTRSFLYAKFDEIDVEIPIYRFGGDFDPNFQYDFNALHMTTGLKEGFIYFLEYYKDQNFLALHLGSAGDNTLIVDENDSFFRTYANPNFDLIPGLSQYVFQQHPSIALFSFNRGAGVENSYGVGNNTAEVLHDKLTIDEDLVSRLSAIYLGSVFAYNKYSFYFLTNRQTRRDITTYYDGSKYYFDYKYNPNIPAPYKKSHLNIETGTLYANFRKDISVSSTTYFNKQNMKTCLWLDQNESRSWDPNMNQDYRLPLHVNLINLTGSTSILWTILYFIPYSRRLDTTKIESIKVKHPEISFDTYPTTTDSYPYGFRPYYRKYTPVLNMLYYRDSGIPYLQNLFYTDVNNSKLNNYAQTHNFVFNRQSAGTDTTTFVYGSHLDLMAMLEFCHKGYGFILNKFVRVYNTNPIDRVYDNKRVRYGRYEKPEQITDAYFGGQQFLGEVMYGNYTTDRDDAGGIAGNVLGEYDTNLHEMVFDYEIKFRD